MLPGLISDIPTIFGLILQTDTSSIHAPDNAGFLRILLRWSHFVAGVVWIGILYFYNLVNVPLMKKLDGPTKKIVVPELMPRSLWYFRWGAVVTVLVGLGYFAMFILRANAHNAEASAWAWLGIWLAVVLVLYAILYAVLQNINNGNLIAVIVAVLVLALASSVLYLFPKADNKKCSRSAPAAALAYGCC